MPQVSIGLPTYNRAATLRRAMESALAQDYPNLELVISDNCSTDETELLCTELARRDSRVRYLRQPVNRGLTANFRTVLDEAHGEFFMWLADDDWLASDYVTRCVRVLREEPEHAIVYGVAKHCDDKGAVLYEGDRINLTQSSGRERVLDYLRQIRADGVFHGVMRRELLLREPLQNTLANDWLILLPVIFTGKVRMLEDAHFYRTDGGASATYESTVRSYGLHPVFAKYELFYLRIAASVFYTIVKISPAFKSLAIMERLSLAGAAFKLIVNKYIQSKPSDMLAPIRKIPGRVRSKFIIRTRLKRFWNSGK